ncbi:phosphate starvation-inducible protein PhoH [Brevibacillus laterosporus]|uniref:phosphate starvation-inducible protein PhoH n=1 Tax=Brevibacillus laterosporus TaxID=1465 RepID=UPI000C77B7DD|nr:phosphate starvation-inducible protein PhoH [Brevibacillus laterosporus]AUM65698.1 phosphate starvation-inducible protein PhoH [Brevibacillus laterosporus]
MAQFKEFLWLDPGHAFALENRTSPFIVENFTQIDQYDFAEINVRPFKCIVIHDFIDQEYMFKHKEKISSFLEEGKIVIFSGHLCKEWLPGCPIFTPKKINTYKDYEISIATSNPIFEGVTPNDMTYNKGVAGFFARGTHSPVPAKAEVLLTLSGDLPVTYIDRHTTKGTILAHAGRDIFAHRMQNKSTDRISAQLLQWIHDEYETIQNSGGK